MQVDTQQMRTEANAKLAAAQAEHRSVIQAIEIIERSVRNGEPPKSRSGQKRDVVHKKPGGPSAGLSAVILKVMAGKPSATLIEVVNSVGPVATKKQVARILYKLHKRGELRITRKQSGPTPALYALP